MQNYRKAFGGLGRQIPSLPVNEDGLAQIQSLLHSFNRGLENREAQTKQRNQRHAPIWELNTASKEK